MTPWFVGSRWALRRFVSFGRLPLASCVTLGPMRGADGWGALSSDGTGEVRLAELVAALSLITDLGLGHPTEHVLRQTLVAMRLAESAGLSDDDQAATYYASLLAWVGCAADTHELASFFADETVLFTGHQEIETAGLPLAAFFASHLGSGRSTLRRIGLIGHFLATAGRPMIQVWTSHCRAVADLASRLGLGDDVREPLLQAFERWDGKGVPDGARHDELTPAIRVVQLADTIEVLQRTRGLSDAVEIIEQRRGTRFDPALVDTFAAACDTICAGIDESVTWDEVIARDPGLGEPLRGAALDDALEALADFADLKSPYRIGHSRGVAALSARAAEQLGLPEEQADTLRRAALVHDLGMVGVPSAVWDETDAWTESQRERARTHPYLTERMFVRSPGLAVFGQCARLHHERLDGSGYPYGLTADAIPLPARVLAAADVYHALGEPRPHRAPIGESDAAAILRDEVSDGRLDGDAVNAVLAAAGHRVRRRAGLPSGLTRREAEVLVLLARGHSNGDIARELTVSRRTVSSHLEHIYTKLGVSTRTEAALYAMRHGLVVDLPST